MSQRTSHNDSRINPLHLLAGLLMAGLSVPALMGQSVQFPTYQVGPQANGTFVASDGTILAPAGTVVNLGIRTRAKAIALNPTGNNTAAVLQMGAPQVVTVFNTVTGAVVQTFNPTVGAGGSSEGIAYTPDGKYLLFSQDGDYGLSYVAVASVAADGTLTNFANVQVPFAVDATGKQTNVTCFGTDVTTVPTAPAKGISPPGTTGSFNIPCGYSVSLFSDQAPTSYPTGIAINGSSAYVVLDNNDTLAQITLGAAPSKTGEIIVGNVPHSVIISPDGNTAYVSNEGGRIATANDWQQYSNGTPVVAKYNGSLENGTVSIVNIRNGAFAVSGDIKVGHHPTGMALWGKNLLVANTYDDTISVIDTTDNRHVGTINLGLPIGVPGDFEPAYGAGPNSIAVDATKNVAYVALYNANAVAVVDLNNWFGNPVKGMIPVGYAPASVVLDMANNQLLVANDKGWGTTGNPSTPLNLGTGKAFCNNYVAAAPATACSTVSEFGVNAYETHQDLGMVSIIRIPSNSALGVMTHQVKLNNHWDLAENIEAAAGGNPWAKPAAIPAHIGDPSKIKHVFVIIRENRTYDQILGDVTGGNGDPTLAVFGDNSQYAAYPVVTPNAHALVQRFPLFDNFYDPSRQSADGHNWIVQAMAPYSDDIQSPDWLRDYPSNGGDAIAYQEKGHLWDAAERAGVKVKNYGEYIEWNAFNVPGCTLNNNYSGITLPFVYSTSCEPSWSQFYNDTLEYEAGNETQLQYFGAVRSYTPLPSLFKVTYQNYPQFDLGIPDQYRFDVWQQDFNHDVATGKVPQLEMMWISSDHTGGPPNAIAMQADNDLALGRFVDAISHSPIWNESAIFVEEDDAQTGVDHVDGHRSPGYVISPYVQQQVNPDGTGAGVTEDSTFYTQVNFTRTIEQILGIKPMNQNDLVASPMKEIFVDNPPAKNFLPWTHVPNGTPLCYGVAGYTAPTNITPSLNTCTSTTTTAQVKPAISKLQAGWEKKKAQIFAGKYQKPDSEDPDTVNHMIWYETTGYKVPFPGEKTVRPASDFKASTVAKADDDD